MCVAHHSIVWNRQHFRSKSITSPTFTTSDLKEVNISRNFELSSRVHRSAYVNQPRRSPWVVATLFNKKKTLLRVGILCDYCMSSFHYSLRRVECGLVENHNYTQPGFLFIGFKSHISLFSFNQLAWRVRQISKNTSTEWEFGHQNWF